jgi:hypothetical protein
MSHMMLNGVMRSKSLCEASFTGIIVGAHGFHGFPNSRGVFPPAQRAALRCDPKGLGRSVLRREPAETGMARKGKTRTRKKGNGKGGDAHVMSGFRDRRAPRFQALVAEAFGCGEGERLERRDENERKEKKGRNKVGRYGRAGGGIPPPSDF